MQEINSGIIKLARSLALKHNRDAEGLFVAEGTKCVRDMWDTFPCRWLICTRAWHDRMANASMYDKVVLANAKAMSRISQFNNPSEVIAVFEKPNYSYDADSLRGNLSLMLDNVQDPGNMGTIVRLADWFGITDIFASRESADVWGHKVVQASMGALARVRVYSCDLAQILDEFTDLPVWGTFLNGDNIYATHLDNRGFVVFGNEGQGISARVANKVTKRLMIPAWPHHGSCSESLNVSIAAAITISEFRRCAT